MATGQYDDAWETPGWTAQNFAYPPSDEVMVSPPEGLRNVAVAGTFFDQRARPMWGVFTFTPSIRLLKVGNAMVNLQPFRVQLRHGQLKDVNILAPKTGVTVTPATWTYAIQQRVGPSIKEYSVPVSVTTADLIETRDLQTFP